MPEYHNGHNEWHACQHTLAFFPIPGRAPHSSQYQDGPLTLPNTRTGPSLFLIQGRAPHSSQYKDGPLTLPNTRTAPLTLFNTRAGPSPFPIPGRAPHPSQYQVGPLTLPNAPHSFQYKGGLLTLPNTRAGSSPFPIPGRAPHSSHYQGGPLIPLAAPDSPLSHHTLLQEVASGPLFLDPNSGSPDFSNVAKKVSLAWPHDAKLLRFNPSYTLSPPLHYP